MNKLVTPVLGAALSAVVAGCSQLPPAPGAATAGPVRRAEWTVARSPNGAAPATQPLLIVPSAENAAEQGVFAEIERLRQENDELHRSVDRAFAESERNRDELAARTAELNASRADLAALQREVDHLSGDLHAWKSEVARMHENLFQRQRDELASLDDLIITVESIMESVHTPRSTLPPNRTAQPNQAQPDAPQPSVNDE